MNSSNIVYSAESASGVRVVKSGEVAQELCVGKVVVKYLCGSDRPASEEEARQNLEEKIKEVKSGTYKEGTSRDNIPGSCTGLGPCPKAWTCVYDERSVLEQ